VSASLCDVSRVTLHKIQSIKFSPFVSFHSILKEGDLEPGTFGPQVRACVQG